MGSSANQINGRESEFSLQKWAINHWCAVVVTGLALVIIAGCTAHFLFGINGALKLGAICLVGFIGGASLSLLVAKIKGVTHSQSKIAMPAKEAAIPQRSPAVALPKPVVTVVDPKEQQLAFLEVLKKHAREANDAVSKVVQLREGELHGFRVIGAYNQLHSQGEDSSDARVRMGGCIAVHRADELVQQAAHETTSVYVLLDAKRVAMRSIEQLYEEARKAYDTCQESDKAKFKRAFDNANIAWIAVQIAEKVGSLVGINYFLNSISSSRVVGEESITSLYDRLTKYYDSGTLSLFASLQRAYEKIVIDADSRYTREADKRLEAEELRDLAMKLASAAVAVVLAAYTETT